MDPRRQPPTETQVVQIYGPEAPVSPSDEYIGPRMTLGNLALAADLCPMHSSPGMRDPFARGAYLLRALNRADPRQIFPQHREFLQA